MKWIVNPSSARRCPSTKTSWGHRHTDVLTLGLASLPPQLTISNAMHPRPLLSFCNTSLFIRSETERDKGSVTDHIRYKQILLLNKAESVSK